jgi:hypothetical protein
LFDEKMGAGGGELAAELGDRRVKWGRILRKFVEECASVVAG